MKHDFIENNIIILSRQTLDLFLEDKNPSDLIGLYCFYYYTAKWQRTNQPKATINYVSKGLKWCANKVRKNKKKLISLGLIQDIRAINRKTKKVEGWYVKINYMWKEETIKNHPFKKPQGGLSQRVEKTNPNALNVNSLNALSVNKEILKNSEKNLKQFKNEDVIRKNYTKQDKQLTHLLYDLVKENFSFIKNRPITEKDYAEMNRLYRIDKREYKIIEFIIRWCQNDHFWRQNIRSAQKLRKQFDTLMIKAKSDFDRQAVIIE